MIRGFYSHLELCHYESIRAQYSSASNAWNVNFNNSNVNNNDRGNSNRVRAFSDCQLFNDDDFIDFFADMLVAYYECRRKKRQSKSEIVYEMEGVTNTLFLALEIYLYKYEISPSTCFIIYIPTIREVFCSAFDTRICHTWIAMRIERLFDKVLPDTIHANRKGKGTSGAINAAYEFVNSCNGWIYKFDIRGFFMSIDIRKLWVMLEPVLNEYVGRDKNYLLWLTRLCVMNRPQKNCIRVCDKKEWDKLPPEKSLFSQDDFHGLPIGDLLSQMCAGLYISKFVRYANSFGFDMIVNYVDDSIIIHESKEYILECIPKFRKFLRDEMGLVLHPHKSYIQHTSKGIAFLGAIIKPHRMYCGQRTIDNAFKKRLPKKANKMLSMINSYLGYFGQYRTYGLRKRLAERCFNKFHNAIMFGKKFLKMILPKPKKQKKKGLKVYYAKEI